MTELTDEDIIQLESLGALYRELERVDHQNLLADDYMAYYETKRDVKDKIAKIVSTRSLARLLTRKEQRT